MSKRAWISGIVTILLAFLSWRATWTYSFYSSDVGLRFLQVQELIDQGWSTFAIDYPARPVDPNFAYVPYYYAYSLIDNQLYLNISPFFPLLVSFCYALLGSSGLWIVPALSTMVAAWATARIIAFAKLEQAEWAFAVAIFTTPLLVYGMTLWDHSFGTALAIVGVLGIAEGLIHRRQRSLFGAGLALGFSLGQRPEMYLFVPSLGLATLFLTWRNWRLLLPLLWGGLIGALVVWGLQMWWVGHPLGMALAPHLLGYASPDFQVDSTPVPFITKLNRLLYSTEPRTGWELGSSIPAITGIVLLCILLFKWEHWQPLRWARWAWIGALILMTIGYGWLVWIAYYNSLIGVITTFPLFPFAVAAIHVRDLSYPANLITRLCFFTATLFLISLILLWPGYGGLQWGARYLLPLYPLLLILAWVGYENLKWQVASGRLQDAGYTPSSRRQHDALGAMDDGRWGKDWRSETGDRRAESTQHTTRNTQHATRTILVLLTLSLLIQSMGAFRTFKYHNQHSTLRANLLAMPTEYIATNYVFIPSFVTPIANSKKIVYVRDSAQLLEIMQRLDQLGIYEVGVIRLGEDSFAVEELAGEFEVTVRKIPDVLTLEYVYKFKTK